MHWTESATADDSHAELEKKLWDAANPISAGADLRPSDYAILDSRTLASLLKIMASISMDKGEVLNTEACNPQARISENVTAPLAP